MRVWDQERGTIRQFADALASESGALPADDIYQCQLGALWKGEFERDGHCAVSLPNANASRIRRGPGGTWLPIDNKGNELRGEFPAFTREDLRDALIGRSSKIRPNAVPSFDVLKDKPISTYEDAYRNVYLNCLLIETKAIKVLLARLRANSGNEPAVDVASTLHKPTKRGRPPEAKARAAEAIRQLFPSGIPEMKQVAFVEVVNKQLKDSGKGPVSSETIARLTGARSDDRKTAK